MEGSVDGRRRIVGAADDDAVEVTVIRSADGCTSKLSVSLSSCTLRDLQEAIGSTSAFGPLPCERQRIFHLGRELKSARRSLKALGVGKHGVYSIHLHSTAPKTYDLQSDGDDEEVGLEEDRGVNEAERVDRNGGGRDDDEVEIVIDDDATASAAGAAPALDDGSGRSNNKAPRSMGNGEVVDLLESDDDDDDEIVVVEDVAQHSKRRRRN